MVEAKTGIFIFVAVLVVVMIVRFVSRRGSYLTSLSSAEVAQTVEASELSSSDSSTSTSNFSYSIWIYVNDWNYRFGETKVIFGRLGSSGGRSSDDVGGDADVDDAEDAAMASRGPCPVVALAPAENNIAVSMAVYPPTGADAESLQKRGRRIHTCGVPNIPLQRWTNVLLSCLDRTMDIYLDGKLVRTCLLPGVPKINSSAAVAVTPNGGFSGWTSKLQYWAHATNPRDAWKIYRDGYNDNIFGNFFGDYSIELNVKNGSEVVNTVSI